MKNYTLNLRRQLLLGTLLTFTSAAQELLIDFNSTNQDGGPHNQTGYQPYNAAHEVADTFTTQAYSAFGTTVSLTPSWPDSPDPRVMQMIDRGPGNDAQWGGGQIDLLTDFIGVDTRTGSGGGGNYNGITGTPTPIHLTITNLPSGSYAFTSFHHDTENAHSDFLVEISVDGGSSFAIVPGPNANQTFSMTSSSTGGSPANPNRVDGVLSPASGNPRDLPSTVSHPFNTTGSPVILRYTPFANTAVHRQFFGINALEIAVNSDRDNDGLPDFWEIVHGLDPEEDGTVGQSSLGAKDGPDGALGDPDNDGLNNLAEYRGADGLAGTGDETHPLLADTDSDGLSDGDEVLIHGTNPLLVDTDGDLFSDGVEIAASTNPNDPNSFPISSSGLLIDFSSTSASGQSGPFHDPAYLPFIASDRNAAEIAKTINYPTTAFGGNRTVSLEVSFPNPDGTSLLENALRMIGRNNEVAASYQGENRAMIRDWIGADTGFANGGNGTLTETSMALTFTGLPAGKYLVRSHHHDAGVERGNFTVNVTDATRNDLPVFTKPSTYNLFQVSTGAPPTDLPSTSNFVIQSLNESTPVVIRYSAFESTAGFEGFIKVNGIEIYPTQDSDSDGIPDAVENAIPGLNSAVFDSAADLDGDGLTNLQEYYLNTLINVADTDGDGLNDGPEVTLGTSPFLVDTDGDGLSDGVEVNELNSNPLLVDTDGDGFSDRWESLAGSLLNDAASIPDGDGDGYSKARDPDDNEVSTFPTPGPHQLFVDFNSNQNGGGDSSGVLDPGQSLANYNQAGYRSYHANHEVVEEFQSASYSAFGSTVTLTPRWPDTTDLATTYQSMGRGNGNNNNWNGDQINLLRDFIGIDTRVSEQGNGVFDGTTGTRSRFQLALGNLPPAIYSWRSYHHDTENVHSRFLVEVSTNGGSSFTVIQGPNSNGTFSMTDSTAGGAPASARTYRGAPDGYLDPANLPSTVNFTFAANGTDEVIIQFTPYSTTSVHQAIFGVNGFELSGPGGLGGAPQITSAQFNSIGNYVIEFNAKPSTTYRVASSLMNTNAAPVFTDLGLSTTTDPSGLGTMTIPKSIITEEKIFYRIEEIIN